jgi:hypothetical protein
MLAIDVKVLELKELIQEIILVLKRQDERITELEHKTDHLSPTHRPATPTDGLTPKQ